MEHRAGDPVEYVAVSYSNFQHHSAYKPFCKALLEIGYLVLDEHD